ncbi:orotate phosphoribosyltransferase [Entomoplasma freundtii]|uniref:Orotate phosphoribosyltransferase n=1 Tax=Entomoplasma freundtii TaxID=74700 RepID=A0A2K8NQL6_9MOLU|nr:orotate phosphoribosyltransferase [Entomoplasma freundtii]ATZ16130.1 orotate phosphoribosyltransferase [Entomoplasma freundtii]TDY56969.1 orotate phosphoribosyltransferase [Entomoplasma freundtii]
MKIISKDTKKTLIQDLINIKAININTQNQFTWASGIKSPIYIDNRLIMSYPHVRTRVVEGLANLINEEWPNIPIDTFFGTATAGIPHAVLLSHFLEKPCGYVRSSKKDHGKGNQIEGAYKKGDQVIVVEDLISTGGSVIKVVESLQQAGLNVKGIVAIFSYDLQRAHDNFKKLDIPYYSLLNFHDLVTYLPTNSSEDKEMLIKFQQNL